MPVGCFLCDEIRGANALSRIIHKHRANPILESDDFVLLPDIHPLVSGHSLLMRHGRLFLSES